MTRKLKQKSGETLIETLFSMLIAVLSMGILCTAVMAANKINQQSRAMDQKYKEELSAAEGLDDNVQKTLSTVDITFYSETGNLIQVETAEVTVYGDDESAFLSYDYEGDTP